MSCQRLVLLFYLYINVRHLQLSTYSHVHRVSLSTLILSEVIVFELILHVLIMDEAAESDEFLL